MAIISLSEAARQLIDEEIDRIFDLMIYSFLGPTAFPKGKYIFFIAQHDQKYSLPGLYFSSMETSGIPAQSLDTLKSSIRIASNYIESVRGNAKANIIHTIETELVNHQKGIIEGDFRDLLKEALEETMESVTYNLKRVISAETTSVKNVAAIEAISKVAEDQGVEDPNVFFAVVRGDDKLCNECKRLHLLKDLITPRIWKLSEISHEYHKRGDKYAKSQGLHPFCRCFLTFLAPGFGYDKEGRVIFKGAGYDEHENQKNVA